VWFLLEDEEILVYSANTARIANIESNPRVALNLDGDGEGGEVVTLEGLARLDPDAPRASQHPAYVGKYLDFMKTNGWSPDDFSRLYPTAIRIDVIRVRAW
jgi:PPOX class probable F420-dependent enzyme